MKGLFPASKLWCVTVAFVGLSRSKKASTVLLPVHPLKMGSGYESKQLRRKNSWNCSAEDVRMTVFHRGPVTHPVAFTFFPEDEDVVSTCSFILSAMGLATH